MGLLKEDLFQAVCAMIKRMLNLDAQISARYVPSTLPGFNLSNETTLALLGAKSIWHKQTKMKLTNRQEQ